VGSGVQSIAIPSAGVLNVALVPTAVAAVAMGPGTAMQGDPEGDVHHICTNKNEISDASGGHGPRSSSAISDWPRWSSTTPRTRCASRGIRDLTLASTTKQCWTGSREPCRDAGGPHSVGRVG
jgi:hypothetical protein